MALLDGIRSVVSALATVIQGLQVHVGAHPVRVMGFPASFALAQGIFAALFAIMAVFLGGGSGLLRLHM